MIAQILIFTESFMPINRNRSFREGIGGREVGEVVLQNLYLFGQWLNFKLFGITYLVGKISRANGFLSGYIGWVSIKNWPKIKVNSFNSLFRRWCRSGSFTFPFWMGSNLMQRYGKFQGIPHVLVVVSNLFYFYLLTGEMIQFDVKPAPRIVFVLNFFRIKKDIQGWWLAADKWPFK